MNGDDSYVSGATKDILLKAKSEVVCRGWLPEYPLLFQRQQETLGLRDDLVQVTQLSKGKSILDEGDDDWNYGEDAKNPQS